MDVQGLNMRWAGMGICALGVVQEAGQPCTVQGAQCRVVHMVERGFEVCGLHCTTTTLKACEADVEQVYNSEFHVLQP